MASPFRMFRRHQKVWMAVLTVGAMIAFVFLSGQGAMQFLDRKVSNDPVRVRTTKFGNLTQGQVQSMVSNRRRLIGFVTDVGKAVYMAEGKPVEAQNLLNYLSLPPRKTKPRKRSLTPGSWPRKPSTWARPSATTKSKGTSPADRPAAYFDRRCPSNLESARIDGEVAFSAAERIPCRPAVLASDARRARAFPPAVLWEYYCRLNRRATAEVAAVPVAQYADRVPAPNNKELEEFFEKYKARYPNAASPEPGFRVPKRIAVQYFAADLDKFADSKDVTKAEVDQEYEAHKDQYEYSIKAELKKIEEEKKAEAEKKTQAAKKAATKKTEPEKKPPADKKDQAEKKTEAGPKPEAKKTDIESKPEAAKKPAVQGAAGPAPETKTKEGGKEGSGQKSSAATKSSDKTSSLDRSPYRLVAFADEKKPADSASGGGSDTTHRSEARREQGRPARQGRRSETACGRSSPPSRWNPSGRAGHSGQAVGGEAVVEGGKGSQGVEGGEGDQTRGIPGSEGGQSGRGQEALERVKDAIRKQLAKQKAWKKIDTIFLGLEDLMNEYQRRKVKAENPSPHAAPAGAPTPLDFAALAKQYGLTSGRTKLLSDTEIVDENIGKSVIEGGTPFQQYAYKTLVTLKPTRPSTPPIATCFGSLTRRMSGFRSSTSRAFARRWSRPGRWFTPQNRPGGGG